MCGIVGILKTEQARNREATSAVLVAMRDRMTHRGPDDAGEWTDGRCFLGHRRLSIIDLSPAGHQPMLSADGKVAVVFNGEIYNHAEFRAELEARGHRYRGHSDTETLLYAYLEWGLDAFKRFFGMWGVAIYDARDQARPVMHLVRDRIGIKPVYVARTGSGDWLFASEIKAIVAHPEIRVETDLTALWHYFTFIVTPAPLTLFRGVFKIPAGWRITIDHTGAARAEQWWECLPDHRPPARNSGGMSEDECVEETIALLRKSISRRMVADVPFGVLLSGGVDSSMNVALMSELMDRPVTTFSIGYRGEEETNEFGWARRVARQYGTDHHETLIDPGDLEGFLDTLVETQDEPIADNVCIPLYFLSKLVRDNRTTVVQVGEGADEHWLGYWWCEDYRRLEADVYDPARAGATPRGWLARTARKLLRQTGPIVRPRGGAIDDEALLRAQRGEELFWGGSPCWWGSLRSTLTPDPSRFKQEINCPVEGLLPSAMRTLDSHAVVRHWLEPLEGRLTKPRVLQLIPYLERKNRLPEHLLMRVDKCTMAHSIEARVPFLDHELVEFSERVPVEYKLRNGVGKHVIKRAAERFLDKELVYRRKQGFGAPMERWFRQPWMQERFRRTLDRSPMAKAGLIDAEAVKRMLDQQQTGGGWSFHLWTVMNAVLWEEKWGQRR